MGVLRDGMIGVDVGGAEDVVSDDGVDVVGGEEANHYEERLEQESREGDSIEESWVGMWKRPVLNQKEAWLYIGVWVACDEAVTFISYYLCHQSDFLYYTVKEKRGQISSGKPCFRRLSAWFGLNHGDMHTSDENQNFVHEPETQQSQASTSSMVEKADQTTNDSAPVQAVRSPKTSKESNIGTYYAKGKKSKNPTKETVQKQWWCWFIKV
ncbi:hypothetical protein Tco_1380861 [Tanacetum coccineum]